MENKSLGDQSKQEIEAQLQKNDQQKKSPYIDLNYHFLDGLRGFGAFAVYLHHFMNNFCHLERYEEVDEGTEKPLQPPTWFRTTPVRIFYQGGLWVKVFFILSGFVLPLRFFKTGKDTCLTGGTFRRYFRLMIPVLMTMSIYYLFMRLDCFGASSYNKIKSKYFWHILYDGALGTWFGGATWFFPAWTLSIELYASYWVFRLAEVVREYRGRFYIYVYLVMWILIIDMGGLFQIVSYMLNGTEKNMPFFIIGVAFADMDTSEYRPFDKLRDLSLWWRVPLNLVLFTLFLFYGSNSNEREVHCFTDYDEQCPFYKAITFDNFIQPVGCQYIGSISIMILCLISEGAQWVLNTFPFQFLGGISYMLYLIHELFIVWMQRDTLNVMLDNGISIEAGTFYIWIIYTPILLFVSWILEITVDTPSKKFSNELDVLCRIKRPPPPKDADKDEDYYSCWSFCKRIWPIFAMIGWLFFVLITTEIYLRIHPLRPMQKPTHEYEEHS